MREGRRLAGGAEAWLHVASLLALPVVAVLFCEECEGRGAAK